MTTLDELPPHLAQLFLRIDAASPTDGLLREASELWMSKRVGQVMPSEAQMADLPAKLAAHAFLARAMTNGSRHWHVTQAGEVARSLLQLVDETPPENMDKRIAVRLRRLFELVAEKVEPHSAMFEVDGDTGNRQFFEVFAAPLAGDESEVDIMFAAITAGSEGANVKKSPPSVTSAAKGRPRRR